jgi:hypothetical protein
LRKNVWGGRAMWLICWGGPPCSQSYLLARCQRPTGARFDLIGLVSFHPTFSTCISPKVLHTLSPPFNVSPPALRLTTITTPTITTPTQTQPNTPLASTSSILPYTNLNQRQPLSTIAIRRIFSKRSLPGVRFTLSLSLVCMSLHVCSIPWSAACTSCDRPDWSKVLKIFDKVGETLEIGLLARLY